MFRSTVSCITDDGMVDVSQVASDLMFSAGDWGSLHEIVEEYHNNVRFGGDGQ